MSGVLQPTSLSYSPKKEAHHMKDKAYCGNARVFTESLLPTEGASLPPYVGEGVATRTRVAGFVPRPFAASCINPEATRHPLLS